MKTGAGIIYSSFLHIYIYIYIYMIKDPWVVGMATLKVSSLCCCCVRLQLSLAYYSRPRTFIASEG